MITFERRTWWQSAARMIPSVRRRQDAALHEAIRLLVDDPSLPCEIGGVVVPHGYGQVYPGISGCGAFEGSAGGADAALIP